MHPSPLGVEPAELGLLAEGRLVGCQRCAPQSCAACDTSGGPWRQRGEQKGGEGHENR